MKSANLNQKILIFILLITQVVFGSLTADKDFVAVFEGNKIYLWYLLLAIYYGVLLLVTIWIVSYLTSLFYKIANKENFNRTAVDLKSVWLLIGISYTHILVLYVNHFVYRGTETLFLFIIPVAFLLISIIRDSNIKGLKKFIAIIPLVIYIGFDIISISAVM
jgi:hypothetical protein